MHRDLKCHRIRLREEKYMLLITIQRDQLR